MIISLCLSNSRAVDPSKTGKGFCGSRRRRTRAFKIAADQRRGTAPQQSLTAKLLISPVEFHKAWNAAAVKCPARDLPSLQGFSTLNPMKYPKPVGHVSPATPDLKFEEATTANLPATRAKPFSSEDSPFRIISVHTDLVFPPINKS